ncbi:MAG: hypothetical protein A3G75_09165 [Verrucomicrobia bacterium RIFCSPLOWO2_12_FULL_64_8]|nr:MAG: hypothetical protein A3G75_09165 [Verrucomicrobia bacterium RIFCSPLOWO2_12_FULL_64_8]
MLSLPSGGYALTVSRHGFESERREITVDGAAQVVDLVLNPARLEQQVEVVASPEGLETFTKLPGTLHETPRSVTVVGADEMRDRNIRTVSELMSAAPGMSTNGYREQGHHFYSRGFRALPDDTRLDGFPGMTIGGSHGANLFGIEEAVLLRGPSSLQHGQAASPGGMVNLINSTRWVCTPSRP